MRRYVWLTLLVVGVVACNHDNEVNRNDIVTDASDPSLINAWGLAFNPMGVAWVSANGTGVSEVYDSNGNHVIPPITIPPPAALIPAGPQAPSTPTGQVFNGDVSSFAGDAFIFVTEDGTISGWQPALGSTAALRVDNSASTAVYKGVTIGTASSGENLLYAANFHNGTVDVYDASYAPVAVAGGFIDPQLPAGFAPFNVAAVNGDILVSYALQDEDMEDDVAGAGNGFIDLYDGDGNLLGRLLSGNELNSPWGMTISPFSFGAAPNNLIVGNFGDGRIHIYNFDFNGTPQAVLAGELEDNNQTPITIDGLWALQFGPGTGGFASDTLYFTAGPNDETGGIFGSLTSR